MVLDNIRISTSLLLKFYEEVCLIYPDDEDIDQILKFTITVI